MTCKERGSRGRITKWHPDILHSLGSVPCHRTVQIRHLLVWLDQRVLVKPWKGQETLLSTTCNLHAHARCILCVISRHPHDNPESGVYLVPSNNLVLLKYSIGRMDLKGGVFASKAFHSDTVLLDSLSLAWPLGLLGATSLSDGSSEPPAGAARSPRQRLLCKQESVSLFPEPLKVCAAVHFSKILLSQILLLDWLLPSPLTFHAEGRACLGELAN